MTGLFVAGWICAVFLNRFTLSRTTSAGMANPSPCVGTPCGVNAILAELIPTHRPEISITGPPLFQRLLASYSLPSFMYYQLTNLLSHYVVTNSLLFILLS